MNKFKKVLLGAMSVLTLGLFVAVSAKVNAGTTNTTYTADFKTGSLVNSTAGYFTAAKGTSAFNASGNCTASFTSIIDGESYSSKKGCKMEGTTTITFTTTATSVSTVTVLWGNNKNSESAGVKLDDTDSTTLTSNSAFNVVSQTFSNVAAGEHIIKQNSNGKQSVVFEIKVVETITTEDGTYTVNYVNNGHGSSQDAVPGVTELPELPVLSETGYTFGGWFYDDSTFEDEATSGDSINANTTLYAKWTVNSSEWCTITFDSNGGSEVASTSQIYGSTYTLPNCTKSGYYLKCWSDGVSTHTGTYTVPSTSTQTLTAQWAECIVFDQSCYFTKADDNNTAAASNAMFTVSGKVNTNSDAPVTYNGQTYNTPLKMESSTTLTFTLANPATIYIAFTSSTGNCNIEGTSYTKAKKTATNGVLVLELDADSYTITKGDTNNIGFIGIIYDKLNKGTTAAVFAEKNTAGTTLRFVGTITGIIDLDDIDTIELILEKDGVATASQIFLTTCYTSVTGTSQTCAAADGTYYVIFRLNGVKGLTGTISKQLKVTFTDGSHIESDSPDVVLE